LSSKRTNQSLFSSLWEVAIAKGWASRNIVDRLEPVGKIGRVVKIYDNETTLNLMAAIMSNVTVRRRRLTVSGVGVARWRGETTISSNPHNPTTPYLPRES
jgi:hypothetical protein